MAMSALIKSLEDIMRKDAGLNGDAQYIEQITWLLFLKAFDAKEMEWEFRPDYRGVIPEGFRWREWAEDKEGITGDALIGFVDKLFSTLKKLDTSDGDLRKFVVRNVFEDINNYMKSGVYLRQLINRINEKVDFIDATQKHTFNDLYEGMLKDLQSAGRAGEFYTPRPVTNFIVEKVDPKLGEIVLDPACGTGGFLTSTIAHIGSVTTTEELEKLQTSINGWEKKPLPYLLAMTNLILHDIEVPRIRHQNSLNRPLSDYSAKDRVDVIVTNPPFGGAEDAAIKQNFPGEFQTSETADLFMALIMNLLKDHGRCGVVLPDGFMFGDGVKATIKEKLLKEYGLHTIVRLPQVFKPYASVNTNLLFFQKGVASQGVWFYRLDYPEDTKSFTKTKPMLDKHFDPVREWWANKHPITEDGFDKARFYTVGELRELNYDFDKCCPFPYEEEEILEPGELIARYQTERANLNAVVDNALQSIVLGLNGETISPTSIDANKALGRLADIDKRFPEDMQKSILQMAIQGKLVEQDDADLPVDLSDFKMKSTDVYEFDLPNKWVIGHLESIADTIPSKPYQILESEVQKEGTYAVISQSKEYSIGFSNEEQKVFHHKEPVVIFGDHTTEIKLVDFDFVVGADGVKIFSPKAILYPQFFYYVMKYLCIGLNKIGGYSRHYKYIKNKPIPIPPLAEQKRIVDRLEKLLPLCESLK